MSRLHIEKHNTHRAGWLRAAVLGANDGMVSTASLIVGVAAAAASETEIIVAGTAGLVAGAMSMAAGEFVSVSSQSDTENADLAREKWEHINQPEYELNELAESFVVRGAEKQTALEIARQLTNKDALAAHAREELGISEVNTARPLQAAMTSAAAFTVGAVFPLSVVFLFPSQILIYSVTVTTLISLAVLGVFSAKTGGADIGKATVRVTFWGAVAMAVTAGVGTLFRVVI